MANGEKTTVNFVSAIEVACCQVAKEIGHQEESCKGQEAIKEKAPLVFPRHMFGGDILNLVVPADAAKIKPDDERPDQFAEAKGRQLQGFLSWTINSPQAYLGPRIRSTEQFLQDGEIMRPRQREELRQPGVVSEPIDIGQNREDNYGTGE
jgi:hypothetical protein